MSAKSCLKIAFWLVGIALLGVILAGADPTWGLTLIAPDTSASPGETFDLPILAAEAVGLAGVQFTLSFDPEVLKADTVTSGTFGVIASNSDEPGKVAIAGARAEGIANSDTVVLIKVAFTVVSDSPKDSSSLMFEKVSLFDENTEPMVHSKRDGTFRVKPRKREIVYNYPNPAEGDHTTFRYYLNYPAKVSIQIFDLSGEFVEEILLTATGRGYSEVKWDLSRIAPGVYNYIFKAEYENGEVVGPVTKKAMVIR